MLASNDSDHQQLFFPLQLKSVHSYESTNVIHLFQSCFISRVYCLMMNFGKMGEMNTQHIVAINYLLKY